MCVMFLLTYRWRRACDDVIHVYNITINVMCDFLFKFPSGICVEAINTWRHTHAHKRWSCTFSYRSFPVREKQQQQEQLVYPSQSKIQHKSTEYGWSTDLQSTSIPIQSTSDQEKTEGTPLVTWTAPETISAALAVPPFVNTTRGVDAGRTGPLELP